MGLWFNLLLRLAKLLGLFRVARRLTAEHARILCYHGTWTVGDDFRGDAMFMLPETFERRLDQVGRLGYTVIPLSVAVDALRRRRRLPPASIVITIDDGWHSTWQTMAPALARRKLPATLYCDTAHLLAGKPVAHLIALHVWKVVGQDRKTEQAEQVFDRACDRTLSPDERFAAAGELAALLGVDITPYLASRAFHYMTPDQLREVAAQGIDVQLHTHNHTMHDLSAAAILDEIVANRSALANILGKSEDAFEHFCYPSGVASAAAAAALASMGIASATTTVTGLVSRDANLHLIPRLIDGDQISDLKFEAELSGFMHLVRVLTGRTEAVPLKNSTSRSRARVPEAEPIKNRA